jgi:hypothetical protein
VANVSVVNFQYIPSSTNINVGDTVIWNWPLGSSSHNVVSTASPVPQGWTNEPTLFSGLATFTNTFNFSGNFPYQCTLHHFTGSITVSAPPNSPPAVSITNPTNGAVFAAPANVTIQASASDSDGTVAGVQFLVDGNVLNNDSEAPLSGTANNLVAGNHSLSAVASDNLGAKNTNTISISVVTPVITSLTNAAKFSGTNFQFSYGANVGLNYVIQRSTNLVNWVSLATNTAASNPVVFVDTGATNAPDFYRVGRMPNP